MGYIPVGLQIREVTNAQVGTYSFHLLVIPQGESIVVAVGEEDSLIFARLEIVGTEIAARVSVRAVMIIPVLRSHLCRNQQTYQREEHSHRSLCPLALFGHHLVDPIDQGQYTKADPDTERVERTHIGVVTLTRLVRRLVQIHHDSQTRQEEQQEGDREVLPSFGLAFLAFASGKLPYQSDNTQEQRDHVIDIVTLVVFEFGRQSVLVA